MKNYNYWCEKCDKDFTLQIEIEEDKEKQLCPDCNRKLKLMGECLTYLGGTFSSMTREQKTENLKKRSSKHFKEKIKPNKDWMDKNYY